MSSLEVGALPGTFVTAGVTLFALGLAAIAFRPRKRAAREVAAD